MSELKTYLFIPHTTRMLRVGSSGFLAIKEAFISHRIAEYTERFSNSGILFTSRMSFDEIDELLNRSRGSDRYMLIDITKSMEHEGIRGYVDNVNFAELYGISLEKEILYLEKKLEGCILSQDFEEAAKIRDEIKSKKDMNK